MLLVSEHHVEEEPDFNFLANGLLFNKVLLKVTSDIDTDLSFGSTEDSISNNDKNFTALKKFYKKKLKKKLPNKLYDSGSLNENSIIVFAKLLIAGVLNSDKASILSSPLQENQEIMNLISNLIEEA